MNEAKWYLRTQDETFGPETEAKLIEWARLGRIQPGQEISDDNMIWRRVEDVPFLDMRFSIDIGDGNPRGPFNKAAAEALLSSGRLPKISTLVEVRAPFEVEATQENLSAATTENSVEIDPNAQAIQEKIVEVEKIVEKEVRVEVPVEKIVEVEKFIEKIVEVPVEKIIEKTVEVEKIVIDDARIKELEGLLAEERRHTAELQSRIDESSKSASDQALKFSEREAKMTSAIKEAVDRENKYVEQIRHLEDELRRLPQAASEVADIQAAVFKIMTDETAEIGELMELEKREFEEAKRRFEERSDRLLMRKREMLKRSGANMMEMTHKALLARPEDPRTSQLRRELEELRRTHEHAILDYEVKVRELTDELRIAKVEGSRIQEGMKDITQLRNEVQHLKEQLQLREKELLEERQHGEHQRQMQASHNQALMARLASLESTSIGTVDSISTNQSRESKQVKLPGWMRFGR